MNNIQVRHGSEGPAYDPYAFTEITFEMRLGTIVHHSGLATWTEWLGKRFKEDQARECFMAVTNFMPEEIEKFYYRAKARRVTRHIRQCGWKNIQSGDGYPGETLTYCVKCGTILDCDFNRSAIE